MITLSHVENMQAGLEFPFEFKWLIDVGVLSHMLHH